MVEEQQQHVMLGRDAEQPCPDGNLPCEVKECRGRRRQAFSQVSLGDIDAGEWALASLGGRMS